MNNTVPFFEFLALIFTMMLLAALLRLGVHFFKFYFNQPTDSNPSNLWGMLNNWNNNSDASPENNTSIVSFHRRTSSRNNSMVFLLSPERRPSILSDGLSDIQYSPTIEQESRQLMSWKPSFNSSMNSTSSSSPSPPEMNDAEEAPPSYEQACVFHHQQK